MALLLVAPSLSHAQYTVGGNATTTATTGCYQLTPATTNKKGYVYYNTPINLNDTIRFKFRVNLGVINANLIRDT